MKIPATAFAVLLAASLPLSIHARVDDANYVRLSGIYADPGGGEIGDHLDGSVGVLFSVGREWVLDFDRSAFQLEFETGWVKMDGDYDGDSGDLQDIPLLLTARYVWNLSDKWSIAAGPSVGLSYLRGKIDGVGSDSDWVFTWGLGVLVSYAISDTLSVDAGYRYLWHDDASFKGRKVKDIEGQVFQIGIRFSWPTL
ncbi:hypothetical protein OPIT5_04590 [Opitutaceae bacterium TAV5]|nr:hypothetical protein OPIT5_04590 [Opitutaceae bacterium TAV5]